MIMSTTKITQKMFFNAVKSFIGEGEQVILDGITYTADMVNEFLDGQIEKLDKKNSHKSKADVEKASKNEDIKHHIERLMLNDKIPLSATQLAFAITDILGEFVSTQKITPQLTKLVNDGVLKKVVAKGKTTYELA